MRKERRKGEGRGRRKKYDKEGNEETNEKGGKGKERSGKRGK